MTFSIKKKKKENKKIISLQCVVYDVYHGGLFIYKKKRKQKK